MADTPTLDPRDQPPAGDETAAAAGQGAGPARDTETPEDPAVVEAAPGVFRARPDPDTDDTEAR